MVYVSSERRVAHEDPHALKGAARTQEPEKVRSKLVDEVERAIMLDDFEKVRAIGKPLDVDQLTALLSFAVSMPVLAGQDTLVALVDLGADAFRVGTRGNLVHEAAEVANLAALNLAIKLGVPLDQPNSKNVAPLHVIAGAGDSKDHVEFARILKSHGADTTRKAHGVTPPDGIARIKGHTEIAKMIRE